MARKYIEFAQKNAQIAQKGSEFAEFRKKWIEAYEAVEYGRKLLAEKDTQLARSQADSDAIAKVFRLGQEMLAQKEIQLAELRQQVAFSRRKPDNKKAMVGNAGSRVGLDAGGGQD